MPNIIDHDQSEAIEEIGIKETIGEYLGVIGFVFFAAALFTLALEVLGYLKHGYWPHYTLFPLIKRLVPSELLSWLIHPEDWVGLHKLLSWLLLDVEVAAILAIVGALTICVSELFP